MNNIEKLEDLVGRVIEALDEPEAQAALGKMAKSVPGVVASSVFLYKANKARKRGDLLLGIFYLLLWRGITSNNSAQVLHDLLKSE